MSENKSPQKPEEDEELANLLESALQDFAKVPDKAEAGPLKATKDSADDLEKTKEDQPTETAADTDWSDEFIRQAAEQFESNITNVLRGAGGPDLSPEQFQQTFQRMVEAAASDPDLSSSISYALQGLSEGAENLQTPFSEQDLLGMFGQTDGGDQNAFMQGMMQSLLSKEVLYPSLKDILSKYPAWLEKNAGTLSAEDRHKYGQQQKLMEDVCAQLEKESEGDAPEQRREQFEKVLGLMQKLQEHGQPPAELVGDLGQGVPFDAQGNPDLNQCCTM